MGNICRSPLAEGIFKGLVEQAGLAAAFHSESAGLGAWHVGEPPDARAQRVARAHGLTLTSRARQFQARDFERFDLVLALDAEVHAGLMRLAPTPAAAAKVRFLRAYDPQAGPAHDVPDPYYGGLAEFEQAFELAARGCRGLLAALRPEAGPQAA